MKFNQVSMNDDKNCQSRVCSDKKYQETQSINMWPVKPSMDMWLPKTAVPYKYTRLCSDKNCQSARCYKKKNSDKNCQGTKFIHMWSLKPEMKKLSYMHLSKPARKQVIHKNCQSANNMCSDKNQVKSVCNDKNCQFTQWVSMWTAMKISDMWSVPKTTCNLLGTQSEVTRNIYSTSKCWYPSRNAV